MSFSSKAAYFGRSAAQGIRQRPFVHGIAVSTLALALFCFGLARSGAEVLDTLVASLGANVQLTAYLADEATPEQAEATAAAVSAKLGLPLKIVTPKDALDRLSAQLGEHGGVFTQLPSNPLPYSLELDVPEPQRTSEALASLAATAKEVPGIVDVEYGAQAVERLARISRALRVGAAVLLLVVVLTTIVIVSATLQLAIYARREEIEIQKLVGATDRFVKAPFLIEGMLQGLLGAGVALLGLWACSVWAAPGLQSLFAFLVGPGAELRLLSPALAAEVVSAGAGLGLVGSFVAVGRFLRV